MKDLRFYPTCWITSLPQFHGCWQKTQDLWVRDKGQFIIYRNHNTEYQHFPVPVPTLQFPQGNTKKARWCLCTQWAALQEGNSELRKTQSFIMGCKQTCSANFRKREILSLNKSLWKEQNIVSASTGKTCRNSNDPWSVTFNNNYILRVGMLTSIRNLCHSRRQNKTQLAKITERQIWDW